MAVALTVQISDALKTQLEQPGIFAYAVYFTKTLVAGDTPHWTTISDGSGSGVTQSQQIALPFPYDAGKVYFVIQSQTSPTPTIGPDAPGGLIQVEGDLNFGNATTGDFRFDSLELTVNGNSFDVANLTDVNSFGIPMSIDNGIGDSRGYAQSGTDMFADILAVSATGTQNYKYQDGPLQTDQRMMAAPADATVPGFDDPPFSSSDWTSYITSLQSNAVASKIVISGWFNGAPDAATSTTGSVWHNAGYYAYELAWDGTYFWLNALDSSSEIKGSSQIKGSIRITPDELANSLYGTYGTADIYTEQGGTLYLQDMGVGANNQWGAVFRDFSTGFTAGYYGATGTSPHGAAHGASIDLNSNSNWDPTYAFGSNSTNTLAHHTYDHYAEQFYNSTNSYGSGYSDNLMKALAVGPLMSLWNGSSNTSLTATLFADSDTPSTAMLNGQPITMGYGGAPQMYNYIAPTGADYVDLTGSGATFTGNNFSIDLGDASVIADQTVAVSLGLYKGNGEFLAISLPPNQTTGSIYNTYTLQSDFTLSSVVTPQTPGTINITGLPVASDGSASWYQITIGTGTAAKTFNLYANSDPASHQFYNPNAAGQADQVQIDGLGTVAGAANPAPQYVSALAISVLGSSGFGLDPSFLTQLTNQETITDPGNGIFVTPYAPVVGSVSNGVFSNFMATPGSYVAGTTPNAYMTANGFANPSYVIATTDQWGRAVDVVSFELADTVGSGSLAFGWWGADTQWVEVNFDTHAANNVHTVLDHDAANIVYDPSTPSTFGSRWNPDNAGTDGYVTSDYTNKVGATNVARIQFLTENPSGGPAYLTHQPVAANADLDGNWTTANALFVPGTYRAVLMEYAASDAAYANPLNKASDSVIFTVGSGGGGDSFIAGGDSIQFNPGTSGSSGAWVTLDTSASTLANGTLLVYFTDGSGNLVDRDGNLTGSLQDAVRAEIGLVKTDSGGLMFGGAQSVYLPSGLQMKFAIESGNGVIEQLPDIQVAGSGSLSVNVTGAGGGLNLSATIDGSPGAGANLALAQQQHDQAWIYVTQGQTLQVDVAGSAWNVNTLHLLRIDVDAADPGDMSDWSVGGVDWGNTPAFRAAVQANWDPGYTASGGRGDFTNCQQWTASQSGYYAPVLVTENGDIFVIGSTANSDGQSHIRMFGQNMFGFEDLTAAQGSDWDFNDYGMWFQVL